MELLAVHDDSADGGSLPEPLAHDAAYFVAKVPLAGRVGIRLLIWTILFSTVIALLSTAGQLYLENRRGIEVIHNRLDQIERSYLGPIADCLWKLDTDQLTLELEGLTHLPNTVVATVSNAKGMNPITAVNADGGAGKSDAGIIGRHYPIIHQGRDGSPQQIGDLYVEMTLADLHGRLLDTAIVILINQGIRTFLASIFFLYLVHRLITRHLTAIAAFLANYDLRSPAPPFNLHRRPLRAKDELDQVVTAFNGMCAGLQSAYREQSETNLKLARDIDARHKVEREVIQLNAALEQRVRQRTAELEAANLELGAFSYTVSHDLRAPLRRIEGFGQLLAEQYGESLGEQGLHFLDRVRAGSRDMAEMIDSFLRLSRATQGEMLVKRVDLSDLVHEIVSSLEEKYPDRHMTVQIEEAVLIEGDRRLLKLALSNLLDNSWKYTKRTQHPAVQFGTFQKDGQTIVFVRDNGAGFSMDQADKLFTPFFRLHRSEDFEGIGIGLTTVKRIVARHDGHIWAKAEVGQGATFFFTCWEGKASDEQS